MRFIRLHLSNHIFKDGASTHSFFIYMALGNSKIK
jgi:hypothetical protein